MALLFLAGFPPALQADCSQAGIIDYIPLTSSAAALCHPGPDDMILNGDVTFQKSEGDCDQGATVQLGAGRDEFANSLLVPAPICSNLSDTPYTIQFDFETDYFDSGNDLIFIFNNDTGQITDEIEYGATNGTTHDSTAGLGWVADVLSQNIIITTGPAVLKAGVCQKLTASTFQFIWTIRSWHRERIAIQSHTLSAASTSVRRPVITPYARMCVTATWFSPMSP
jgi:hypothetical protein